MRLTTRAGALLQGGDDAIVATEWWHTTQYPVSGAEAFDPSKIQHVGTEDAARHRMVSRENIDLMGDGKCRDLYRIRLSPGVTVLPEIVVESFSSFLIYFRPEPKTVLRYINAYEAPGDISLFLGADAIQDVELVGQVCNRTVRVAAERRLVPLAEIR